jgi:hypothetical protein
MRYALLLAMAVLLGSCSQAVSLIIENQSGTWIILVSRDQTGDHNYNVEENRSQRINWPDPEHDIKIIVDGCTRTFNLDEYYSPWNDWRDTRGELSRRYVVNQNGGLQIVRPDASHSAYKDLSDPPSWRTKSLTHSSEHCDQKNR